MDTNGYDFKKLDDIKVNFIAGPGRSGTTLLVYVLNQSENCVATPEIKHLLFFYRKYKDVNVISEKLIAELKRYLYFFKSNKQFSLSSPESKTWLDVLEPGQSINYSQLSKLFYLSLIEDKNDINTINCIVDKNPYYTFYIDKILTIFPEAKFVIMVRDYRAYVLSNRQSQKPLVKILSVFYYAAVWKLHLKKALAAIKDHGEKIKIVRYEDLAMNKEKTVEEIVTFLDVKYSPELFDFYKSVDEKLKRINIPVVQYERAAKKLQDLSSPINISRVESWKTQLTGEEMEKADFICSEIGQKLGYMALTNPGVLKKMFYSIVSLPGKIRVKVFILLDFPALNYLINLIPRK